MTSMLTKMVAGEGGRTSSFRRRQAWRKRHTSDVARHTSCMHALSQSFREMFSGRGTSEIKKKRKRGNALMSVIDDKM